MKHIITYLLIIFFLILNNHIKADNIQDFEIEEISIGDSLLDYFTLTEIINKQNSYSDKGYQYKSKDYFVLTFTSDKFNNYDSIQVFIKDGDKDYKIQQISGLTAMDINECYSQFDKIEKALNSLFSNADKTNKKKRKHVYDDTGKSTTTDVYYYLKNGSYAALVCVDWSNEIANKYQWDDVLRVEMGSANFVKWFDNEAY